MEWVETTGQTVQDALEIALDQLGVDESDIEYQVTQEPRSGLLGFGKSAARVRARVRPQAPRMKDQDHHHRRHRDDKKRSDRSDNTSKSTGRKNRSTNKRKERRTESVDGTQKEGKSQVAYEDAGVSVPLTTQGDCASEFLDGLLDVLEIDGDLTVDIDEDEELVRVAIEGDQLGHLIGPRGATLQAIQELTRTVVQRKTDAHNGRIVVDISGYREKRKEALSRFVKDVAQEVLDSQISRTLEPMNPADRKVVHDVVNGIDGVKTHSEGETNRRHVVIEPSGE